MRKIEAIRDRLMRQCGTDEALIEERHHGVALAQAAVD